MASAEPSLTCSKLASWMIAAVLLQILGLSLFVIGFFPVKATLPGFSGLESYQMPACEPLSEVENRNLPPVKLRSLYKELSKVPPAYNRLVLMVIDGLPAEFVLGGGDKPPTKAMMEAMPYTQSLLSSGKARAYHAKAAPPTVTMPRLKAMVSGAIGGFLDVAFNFNTQALLDDNLLDQFKRIGWKLVMLGDETWIKLFPGLFSRQDGVSSFYVKDTVEVDYNVSRHLGVELAAEDWNFLILHYLGLDHVGHIGGRHSILMASKLKEMDDVIKMIHTRTILHQHNPAAGTLLPVTEAVEGEKLSSHGNMEVETTYLPDSSSLITVRRRLIFDDVNIDVVVSDHGMTAGGNHGGSSFEETDSLAFFVGSGIENSNRTLNVYKAASQVDITPTLALLFGVPIPKNNIGVLLREMFDTLTDEQMLRALQLNSWQLLRLLQAHSSGFLCGNLTCISVEMNNQTSQNISSTKENLCYLFSRATFAHNMWLSHQASGLTSKSTDDLGFAITSYYDFLGNASEWLSHRATDKPIKLLLSGIAIMLISCSLLLNILFRLFKEIGNTCNTPDNCSCLWKFCRVWHLDEAFTLVGIFIHVLSLGASSLVEEEQYTWHFLTSTLCLIFLLTTITSLLNASASDTMEIKKHEKNPNLKLSLLNNVSCSTPNGKSSPSTKFNEIYPASSILVVLILGRILRGWHQGGVNWVHLPDIAKWLVQAGVFSIMAFQIAALLGFVILGLFAFSLVKRNTYLVRALCTCYFFSGFLVLLHIINSQCNIMRPSYSIANSVAQIFYMCAGSVVLITVLVSPWIFSVDHGLSGVHTEFISSFQANNKQSSFPQGIRDCIYLIGTTCTVFWCLLQLLLQQPINDIPFLVICLQQLACIFYFSSYRITHRQWVEVVALYFLGMTGHFGLGNSNNLATIDVAGAFIGISNHSTILSGFLMFMITYSAPMLSFLSMVIYLSVKDLNMSLNYPGLGSKLMLMIGFPCLLPLALNSVVLVSFTVILLLMRNHLFVWSVFSPKYLYVCASTMCTYVGVLIMAIIVLYTCFVFVVRTKVSSSSCKFG